MSRRYATYDGGQLGSGLELQQGARVLTTDTGALDINRMALGTVAVDDDANFYEIIIYGTADLIDNVVSIGICTANSPLACPQTYVGADDESIGYRVAEGEIHNDGVAIQSFTTIGALGSVIGVELRLNIEIPTVAFYLDGTLMATVIIPAQMLSVGLYIAVSLGSGVAGDILAFLNTGKVDFEYPSAVSSGWWEQSATNGPLRISTREYLSSPSSSPANTRWCECITSMSSGQVQELVFWPESDSTPRASTFVVTVADPDGLLDGLVGGAYRDEPVEMLWLTEGESLEYAQEIGSYLFESCEVNNDGEKTITLRDDLVLLERPLQTRMFRPDVNAGLAFSPWPTTIGVAFSIEPPLYDTTNLIYALDSEGAIGVGKVRDSGDPLSLVDSPQDYELAAGGQTLTLQYDPFGIVTVDVSVTGAAYTPPEEEIIDALNGDGNPFAGAEGAVPTDWLGYGAFPPTMREGYPGVVIVDEIADYATNSLVYGGTLTSGKSYVWTMTIGRMPQRHGSSTPALFVLSTSYKDLLVLQSDNNPSTVIRYPDGHYITLPYTFSGVYSATASENINISTTMGGVSIAGDHFTFYDATFIEVIPVSDGTDEEVEEALQPLQLESMLRQIIETRSGLSSDYWSAADAAAIDTEVGYRGSGFHSKEQTQRREPIDKLLLGYNAAIYKDTSGVLRIARLVAPEDEASTWTLREADMLSELIPIYDEATNLTTQIAARHNWRTLTDTDIVSDELDVTYALRRKLTRDDRYTLSTGTQLADGYDHAEGANSLKTLLVDADDAQAAIDEACAVYASSRCFYEVDVPLTKAPAVGTVGTVYYARYGLSAGVKMHCRMVQTDWVEERAKVRLFGLAPCELIGD